MSDHKTWYLKSDSRDFLCKIHLNHQNHHMRGVILRSRLSADGGQNQKSYFNAKNGTFHIHSYKLGACNVKLYNNKKTERLKILESLHLQGDLGQNIGILLDICFSFRNAFFSWIHNIRPIQGWLRDRGDQDLNVMTHSAGELFSHRQVGWHGFWKFQISVFLCEFFNNSLHINPEAPKPIEYQNNPNICPGYQFGAPKVLQFKDLEKFTNHNLILI